MKKIIILLIAVLLFAHGLYSQESRKGQKAVYLELAGNGVLYSINYEIFLSDNLSFRLGGSIIPFGGLTATGTVMLNKVWGKERTSIETGFGITFITGSLVGIATDDMHSTSYLFTGNIGLRVLSKKKRSIFRIGFTPLIFPSGFIPSVGISFGSTWR